jgi:hypothetical protein
LIERHEIDIEAVEEDVEAFALDAQSCSANIDAVVRVTNCRFVRSILIERRRIDVNATERTDGEFLLRSVRRLLVSVVALFET